MTDKQKKTLIRIIIAAVMLLILHFVDADRWILFPLYVIPYLIVGYDILKKAGKGIVNRQPLDENLLMCIATVGAFALALYRTGEFAEAVAVMLFYQVGEFFQSYAVGRSRKNIGELMDIRPDHAEVITEEGTITVDPQEVEIGSLILVKPGEKIPLDGVVEEGSGSLDSSALTGESRPMSVKEGDQVLSGCVDLNALLKIRTTCDCDESTASKILDLVENAGSRKAVSEKFISRFARVYTPVVVIAAVLLAVAVPLVRIYLMGADPQWGEWIYRALTFLVISCPCALVISIPLSFFAGIGGASRQGILIKGSNFLEALSRVKTVVLDKTGTLTSGSFKVLDIFPAKGSEHSKEDILAFADAAESYSSHPIAQALREAFEEQEGASRELRAEDVREIAGQGVIASIEGSEISAGNAKLLKEQGIEIPEDEIRSGTIVYLAKDGSFLGSISIGDSIKEGAAKAMEELRKRGVNRIVMLSGDETSTAMSVAEKLGIKEVYSRLLPQDKVERLEKIIEERDNRGSGGGGIAFVGDGINDAPVLARADVGIAMGAIGSDAAIEAADVVLMDDDPRKIAGAMKISRRCMGIVWENTIFAIGVKILCLLLCAVGIAGMWLAIFADVGVMVLAVLNAMRALTAGKP